MDILHLVNELKREIDIDIRIKKILIFANWEMIIFPYNFYSYRHFILNQFKNLKLSILIFILIKH